MQTIDIIRAKDRESIDASYAIRMAVFVSEQQIPIELEIDSYDEISVHYLLTEKTIPAATARVYQEDGYAVIGRLAVLKEFRGRSLGSTLMRHVLAEITSDENYFAVKLGAQIKAVPFYSKLGFEPYGELYDDAGIPHIPMRLLLSRSVL